MCAESGPAPPGEFGQWLEAANTGGPPLPQMLRIAARSKSLHFGNNRKVHFLPWGDLLYLTCDPLPVCILRHALHGSLVGWHVGVADHDKDLSCMNASVVIAKPMRHRAVFF